MVTGIKIARGVSASAMEGRALGGSVEAGMPDLATGLVQIGVTAGGEMSRENRMGFQRSSDFVLGYRVSLINMQKDTRRPKVYTRGATMVSDDVEELVDGDRGDPEAIHGFAILCRSDVFADTLQRPKLLFHIFVSKQTPSPS